MLGMKRERHVNNVHELTIHAHFENEHLHYTNGLCGPHHMLYTGFISFGTLNKHASGDETTKYKEPIDYLYCVILRATPPTALRIIFLLDRHVQNLHTKLKQPP